MATLLEIYKLQFQSPEFTSRVNVSVAQTAKYILIEDPATPNHAERIKWADYAMINLARAVAQVMTFVVTDAAIVDNGVDSTDEQINAAVAAAVNPIANSGLTLKAKGE
jgi:hypothetical protein